MLGPLSWDTVLTLCAGAIAFLIRRLLKLEKDIERLRHKLSRLERKDKEDET